MTYVRNPPDSHIGGPRGHALGWGDLARLAGPKLGGRIVFIGQVTRNGHPVKGSIVRLHRLLDSSGHPIQIYQPGKKVRVRFWPDHRTPGTKWPSTVSDRSGHFALHSTFLATSVDVQTAVIKVVGPESSDCLVTIRVPPVHLPAVLGDAIRILNAPREMLKDTLKNRLRWATKAVKPSPEHLAWGALLEVDVGAGTASCRPKGCRVTRVRGGSACSRSLGLGAPKGPIFRLECAPGCAPMAAADCRKTLRRNISHGIRLCEQAATKLEAPTPDASTVRRFRRLFGHKPSRPVPWAGGKASGLIVAHRLRKVAAALRGRGITYRCEAACPAGVNARTNGAVAPSLIRLCPRFWTQSRNHRTGIIIHETLHLLFHSFFHHAGHPSGDPERRRDNAHCYEAFVLRAAGKAADPSDVAKCRARPA